MADSSLGDQNGQVVEILRAIWNEMKTLNGKTDRVREELSSRLDRVTAELSGRIDNVAQGLADLRGEVVELRQEITELREETAKGLATLDVRLDNFLIGQHGREHGALRDRVTRIETHLGLPPIPGGS
jgi:putative component of toxin-antitoxin plasmid stabilization module